MAKKVVLTEEFYSFLQQIEAEYGRVGALEMQDPILQKLRVMAGLPPTGKKELGEPQELNVYLVEKLRELAGISKTELSIRCGKNDSWYRKWLMTENYDYENSENLARAFGLYMQELCEDELSDVNIERLKVVWKDNVIQDRLKKTKKTMSWLSNEIGRNSSWYSQRRIVRAMRLKDLRDVAKVLHLDIKELFVTKEQEELA